MQHGELLFYQLNPLSEFIKTKNIWQSIEKNADNSFYLSWEWMGNWLGCLTGTENITFIYAEFNQQPVFCYFLGLKKGIQSKIIYCNRAYLNRTGNPQKDQITLEHNGILIDKDYAQHSNIIFEKNSNWDELVAQFVSPDQIKYLLNNNSSFNHRLEEEDKAFYVDLQQVRQSDNNLLPLLSSNKRSQIKRSLKAYEKQGAIRLEIAKTLEEALAAFDKLKELHQASWQKKGLAGSFSSSFPNHFHHRLISKYYPNGNIQLVTVYSGDSIIGCLYNFIYKQRIYFYQSGFVYHSENIYRPGLVTHLLAINHYAASGYQIYDFLVGEMDYKKSLSTHSYDMFSYRLRKHKKRFIIEDKLRKLKQKFKSLQTKNPS